MTEMTKRQLDKLAADGAFIVASAITQAAIASNGMYQPTKEQLAELGFFARQGVRVRLKAVQPKDDGKTWLLEPPERNKISDAAKENLARWMQYKDQMID